MTGKTIEISRKQAQYIREANHRWNIKMGATQSGKTYLDTLYLIPTRLLERSGKDGLNFIVGVTKETIERNVLSKMRAIWGVDKVSEINSKNRATIFGEMVYCIGAKDKGQAAAFRGATAKYLYIDEFPDISEDVFTIFSSRLSCAYSCADMTGNPKDPAHWSENFLRKDIDLYFQRYTLYDNPFLTPQTIQDIERDYRGTVYFDRYVLGLPKRAEGLVFSDFADNTERYMCEKSDVIGKPWLWCDIGFDIGGNNSAYAMTCSAMARNGVVYVLKSRKKQAQDLPMEDVARFALDFIAECEREYGVRISTVNTDHVDVIINTLNEKRYIFRKTYKPPLEDRPFQMTLLMSRGCFKVVRGECDDLVDELQQVVFDDRAEKPIILDDGSMQIDTVDSMTYSLADNWHYLNQSR